MRSYKDFIEIMPIKTRRPKGWDRMRYQMVGCVLVGAILPFVIRVMTFGQTDTYTQILLTLGGNIAAMVVGGWLFRNVSSYPGVEASAQILPAFSLSYSLLLIIFVFDRLPYNRPTLILGYALSVAWFFILYARLQRRQLIRVGLAPFGDPAPLRAMDCLQLIELEHPETDVSHLDAVALDLRIDIPDEWGRALANYALLGLPVYHIKHLAESLSGRVELEHLSESSFGTLAPISAYMSIKHVIDWIAALLILVAMLPIIILVALAIRLTSPGPAFFRQTRMGYRGIPFTVYKFRTMSTTADPTSDARTSAMTKDNDSRITPFGRFLRHSRIDEIPQILNILKGEMSWIGPRPEAEVLSRWYEKEIAFYRYRHIVRPGIAGWAQVCQGHVTQVDEVKSKLYYDFFYIKHFSLWIDVLVVIKTLRTVLTGFGSR